MCVLRQANLPPYYTTYPKGDSIDDEPARGAPFSLSSVSLLPPSLPPPSLSSSLPRTLSRYLSLSPPLFLLLSLSPSSLSHTLSLPPSLPLSNG